MHRILHGLGAAMLVLALSAPAFAYDRLVEKKTFHIPSYTTVGGKTIKDVKVGYETYGTLNPDKSNAILVTHFYSATSHAAGKYQASDAVAGYWDTIIGSGKAIDTDKFFVISSDTLVNLNAKDPTVITTGPASINPDTGKPYGLSFPIVLIRDFVEVQKALVESLGIRSLRAVVGASMGSMQAFEWAAAYPDMVQRIVPVIPAAEADAFTIGWLDVWASPIKLDPAWNNGDYYGKEEPTKGLTLALKTVTLHARHPGWADKGFGRKWADPARDPAADLGNDYAVVAALDKAAAARAAKSDANHFLYLARANQLFMAGGANSLQEGLAKVKAKALIVAAESDLLLMPSMARKAHELLKAAGCESDYIEIKGDGGHLDGVLAVGQVGDRIKAFLEN